MGIAAIVFRIIHKGVGVVLMIMGVLILLLVVLALLPMGFKCAHCGKRRSLITRLMSLDGDICNDCVDVTNREIREKMSD